MKNEIVNVEGMTTYEDLVNATLEYGYLPTVVPELKSITIGGAISGIGIESSSFRYGLVHETVEEIEVLLGDGRVVLATPTNKHKDLFFAMPNSYGTLGYVLRCKVKIYKAKKYVKLTHIRCHHPKDYYKKIKQLCTKFKKSGTITYVDGSIFSAHEMYITVGEPTDKAPYTSDYTYMKQYFRSIQKRKHDYVTALDYIWRWDTDWFWCSKHFGVYNPIIRFFWGRQNLNSKVYWKIRTWANKVGITSPTKSNKESVVQDVMLPIETCEAFFKFFIENIPIRPFWNCPVFAHNPNHTYPLFEYDKKKLFVNFGFWDGVRKHPEDPDYHNKLIENMVDKLKGVKSLYSTVHYSRSKFWKLYSKSKYDTCKKKYDKKRLLRDLYDKTTSRQV